MIQDPAVPANLFTTIIAVAGVVGTVVVQVVNARSATKKGREGKANQESHRATEQMERQRLAQELAAHREATDEHFSRIDHAVEGIEKATRTLALDMREVRTLIEERTG